MSINAINNPYANQFTVNDHLFIDLANCDAAYIAEFFAQFPAFAKDQAFVEALRIARNEVIRKRFGYGAAEWDKLPTYTVVLQARGSLYSRIFPLYMSTLEHPEGVLYPQENRPVIAITPKGTMCMYVPSGDSQVKVANAFSWSAKDFAKKCKNPLPIGIYTEEGKANLAEVAAAIVDETDRQDFVEFFKDFPSDLILAKTPLEHRQAILVTKEMVDAGFDWLIDEWVATLDKDGNFYIPNEVITPVAVNDGVILNTEVYRIEAVPFDEGHICVG
jgi:hypothetical protein